MEAGMLSIPLVNAGTAVLDPLPPPTTAFPFETEYVHVTPFTVATSATNGMANVNDIEMQHTNRRFMGRFSLSVVTSLPTNVP